MALAQMFAFCPFDHLLLRETSSVADHLDHLLPLPSYPCVVVDIERSSHVGWVATLSGDFDGAIITCAFSCRNDVLGGVAVDGAGLPRVFEY